MDPSECMRTESGFRVSVHPGIPTYGELQAQFKEVHESYKGKPFRPTQDYEPLYRSLQGGSWWAELSYIHPNRPCSVNIALQEMKKHGLRPAFFEEALALFRHVPEELARHPVVALGSEKISQNGGRFIALFYKYEGENRLFMDPMPVTQHDGLYFTDECRFLAAKM